MKRCECWGKVTCFNKITHLKKLSAISMFHSHGWESINLQQRPWEGGTILSHDSKVINIYSYIHLVYHQKMKNNELKTEWHWVIIVSKDLVNSDTSIWCYSPYRLMTTETHSKVSLCTNKDTVDRLLPLIHLPVKDFRDFYSLGDIVANGQKLEGSLINILAAVKSVR